MQTKYLCVLIHIWIQGEVGAVKPVKALQQNILMTVPRWFFFCGSFTFFLSCFCYAFVRVCLFVPCGHLLGKGCPFGSRMWCLTVSLSLSHWYPGSGVVLYCIDSWSLHPYLLQTDWIQIRPDILWGLFWVQTVCESYQQTTLGDK